MFNKNNFCHVASNNRNEQKAGLFVYKTTDNLDTVLASGYFNEKIVDINLHDLIIHEWHDPADRTKVQKNVLCVVERTLDNVGTSLIKSDWQEDIEQEIIDLANIYLKLDGTNTMTGPLKMRSSVSFKCAIAPSWDGVGFYKLNDNDSLTLMASMESTDGLTPAQNNTYNFGKASHKWKDAYIARVITSVINNGYDIAVPVTNQADTLALKSQVDLAANSGRMITDEGVWYAKMAAAGTIPAEAAVEGRNYADFTQVDGSGNPIIVIYTYTSGAWTQTETIIPPAEYDGYVPVTSKIWDIAEQAGQQGGRILWNHQSKEFTPYPMIVSFENIDVTGESTVAMPVNPVPGQIVNKQYVDDIADPLKYATNCITDIPQDIKLELNAGVLTLKAGSKYYTPNGSGVFDETILAADLTFSAGSADEPYFLIIASNGVANRFKASSCYSGPTAPTVTGSAFWWDTTNNLIKFTNDSGATWSGKNSLPIAICTPQSSAWVSIGQVFNGFGYFGTTVFALPGLKTLAPNGRNADGTLKNTVITNNAVKIADGLSSSTGYTIALSSGSTLSYFLYREYSQETYPGTNYRAWYRPSENILYNSMNSEDAISPKLVTTICYFNASTGEFSPKYTFHAVDYNDIPTLLSQIYPVGAIYIGTQSTCPMAALIPGSSWSLVSNGKALWTGDGTNGNTTIAAGLPNLKGYLGVNGSWSVDDGTLFKGSSQGTNSHGHDGSGTTNVKYDFDAHEYNSIYQDDVTTVQPPAYVVNVWRRTA